jgi:hypothetical protein
LTEFLNPFSFQRFSFVSQDTESAKDAFIEDDPERTSPQSMVVCERGPANLILIFTFWYAPVSNPRHRNWFLGSRATVLSMPLLDSVQLIENAESRAWTHQKLLPKPFPDSSRRGNVVPSFLAFPFRITIGLALHNPPAVTEFTGFRQRRERKDGIVGS